jgi:hypothetical protein
MALDASIYGRFQPKSAASYAAEFEQLAGMREQRQDNALARAFRQEQMGQARAQAERGNALRALQQGLAGKSDEEVAQGMRAAGFIDEAATYETGALDRQTKRNTARTGEATAAKSEAEAFSAALNQYATLLPRITDPRAGAQWVQAQYQDPRVGPKISALMPVEDAIARIPQDPQQFAQWRDEQAMGIAEYRKMLEEQRKPAPAAKLPPIGELQAYRETLPPGDPRRAEVDAAIRKQTTTQPAAQVNINTGDKPLPASVVKQQDEIIDRLTTARSIQSDMAAFARQIDDGKLDFGPVRNLVNQGRNLAGASNEESRNFASFKSGLEKLRNDSLRLNTGVQTDGDAQRAWSELFQNINDRDLVRQRLREIEAINARGAQLQEYRLQVLRGNFGAGALPPAPQMQSPSAAAPAAMPNMPAADAIAAELARRRGQ